MGKVTARNYAAQAERDLLSLAKDNPNDNNNLSQLAACIKKSIHFAIPDGGILFNDDFKGIESQTIKLPYESITLEFYSPSSQSKWLVLAIQKKCEILVFPCVAHANSDHCFIPQSSQFGILSSEEPFKHKITKFWLTKELVFDRKEMTIENNKAFIEKSMSALCEFVEALSCKNVKPEPLEIINPRKNERRIKAGKLPLYETKILTIETPQWQTHGCRLGGTHASPRQHLRRGHIRRLERGNIWINSCVVGDPSKGKIDKTYRIIA